MPQLGIEDRYFDDYPPQAKRLATDHLALLRALPVAFAELLLQQIQAYDWRFPAERRDITQQLSFLESRSAAQRNDLLAGFERLRLPPRLTDAQWARSPGEFSEQLSTYLWSTHQIGTFREASVDYLKAFRTSAPDAEPAIHRLGIAVIGKGVERNSYPLFRKFRAHGTYFTRINPENGLQMLLDGTAARAAAHPSPFDHWYIDGGSPEPFANSLLAGVSYTRLEPTRRALLSKIDRAIQDGIGGPEALVALLHRLRPDEIGLSVTPDEEVLSHFTLSLLTAGSGTQIFSTSFVQWSTRELWRRAQPLTVLARFAPRQRQRPMNELLSHDKEVPELDPIGSLIDADMGAFYMWLDQQRLSGAEQSCFLLWFEDHREALVISPKLPRNTESASEVNLQWLLSQVA